MKNRNLNKNKDSGFVLLFVVVLSSIILSIALGIADIAYKEFTFSTSAKNTNEAFFAADTGIECALYHDQSGATSAFGQPAPTPALTCAGTTINISAAETPPDSYWTFEILELGSSNKACAIVTVHKNSVDSTTEIISKGYNVGGENPTCTSTDINRLERELVVSYSDIALTADTFTLNMAGSGTVVSDETPTPLINCSSSCSHNYTVGDTVVLTATPTTGTDNIAWTGCDSVSGPGGNQCNITITATTNINVTFTSAATYIVTPSAGSNGTISPSTPQNVISGNTTVFTVTPDPTYSISSVSGCGGSLAGSTYTTGPITSDCTVSATFTSSGFTLNVSKSGTGSGTAFTVLPSTGINCGTDCSEIYPNNTSVVVRATAISGSTFSGWTGCDSVGGPGNNTCTVNMTSAKNITASFTLNTYTVTATAGVGGTVSPGSVSGILSGGSAQFTVTPNGGYSYGPISGTCPVGYTSDSNYIIGNITANCTVNFSFNSISGFAQERATSVGSKNSESLSHDIAMGFSHQANDLLIAFVAFDIDGTGPTSTSWPSGWTQLLYNSQSNGTSSNVLEVRYKITAGSESNLVINTNANSVISYKITSIYNYNTTSPFISGIPTFGNSINPNSPNLNVPWGLAKNLWFSVLALDNGGLQGDNTIVTGYPSSYFNGQRQSTYGASLDPNGVALVWAKSILESASQDPSAHTLSAIDRWISATIGVRGQ